MDRELDGVPDTHRSRSFEIYVACSAVSFFLSYVLTYVYSFYYGKMTFASQFHPGSDFPGSYVDPAIHDPEKYNLGVHFFGDFWSTLLRSGKSSPYLDIQDLGSSSYPPFAHLFFRPLTLLPYPLALTFFILGSVVIVALPFHLGLKNQSKGDSSFRYHNRTTS
jgi:ABC-type sugar transport system permease subunit